MYLGLWPSAKCAHIIDPIKSFNFSNSSFLIERKPFTSFGRFLMIFDLAYQIH